MTDLLIRIAGALKARDEAATAGIDDPFLVEHASYEELADAVIQELGLTRESPQLCPGGSFNYRYTTDWYTLAKALP